jgi:hypothetical protein
MAKQEKRREDEPQLSLFPFQLIDIRLYELSMERCDPEEENIRPAPVSIGLGSSEENNDSEEFGLLLTFNASFPLGDHPRCKIHLALEGLFRSVVDFDTIKPDVIERFKSNDAMILFWPYLRQILHDITERMRLDIPPLPIIDPRGLLDAISEAEESIPETT